MLEINVAKKKKNECLYVLYEEIKFNPSKSEWHEKLFLMDLMEQKG